MSSQQYASHGKLVVDTLLDEAFALFIGKYQSGKERRIGIEIEMPFVDSKTLNPISFEGDKSITSIFNALQSKGPWVPGEMENGKVTALDGSSGSITLEPGGQIEFASKARKTLAEIAKDIGGYFEDCKSISPRLGVDVLPFGFHPHIGIEECPYIEERSRFKALKPIFDAERGYSAWGQSCSVQVTLDSPHVEGAFEAFKLGLKMQPIAAAMFANSPFQMGEDSGYQSWRRRSLQGLDSPLYAVPEAVFEPEYTLKDWAAHILTVPMSFVVRDDTYIAVAPKPFAEMVEKPLPELAHLPEDQRFLTRKDLLDHATGIKPEMLLKPGLLLEYRAADLGPSPQHWMAVGAFWTGIFYDKTAFQEAQEYMGAMNSDERTALRRDVAKTGIDTVVGDKTVQTMALDLLVIAKKGLERVEPEAASLLDPLMKQIGEGMTPAKSALRVFQENAGDMTRTLQQTFLFAPQSTQTALKKAI